LNEQCSVQRITGLAQFRLPFTQVISTHNVGMSEAKKFCPTCQANTMEPVEGILLTKEEYDRVEDGRFVFQGKLTAYRCPVCSTMSYYPARLGAWQMSLRPVGTKPGLQL
jgi:hypothetical protein